MTFSSVTAVSVTISLTGQRTGYITV